MKFGILILCLFALLLLSNANAVYELCDSVERVSDLNNVTFTCYLTTSKIEFTQDDIDDFWEEILADEDYVSENLKIVEWKIESVVVQVADDIRFIEPPGMDMPWDIILTGDSNTTHDFNQSASTPLRPANQTAIKKRIGGLQEFFISFAPLGERRGVRNITLEKPIEALGVYISGSTIKKMDIDIEGTLSLSGGYIENLDLLKAKSIILSNTAYLQNINSIKAENISLESNSYIRTVGSFDETAIKIENSETGLIVKGKSYIENVNGYIEVDSDIYLEEESGIKNLSYTPSETIQLIQADNLTLKDESYILGIGGKPGEIILSGTLSLENSKIIGRGNNKPSGVKVNGILMSDNSLLQGFEGNIEVEGKETFVLESGSIIGEVLGIINSCSKLSMDGNETKIRFLENSPKEVKANGIDLNNDAKIECIGEADCNYFYIYQSCDVEPTTNLEVTESQSGNVPFTIGFVGECNAEGTPITCTIDFGDGSGSEVFDTNASHTYLTAGSFKAVLTGQTTEMSTTSEKTIVVVEAGVTPPTIEEVQASLSVQTVQNGGEVNIILECDDTITSFSIENNLGLPAVTTIPKQCPATLGPFKIPETTAAGTYSFVVKGATKNGTEFAQTLTIAVETRPLIPWLPFELDGLMIYGIIGIVGIIAVVVIIVIIKKKKGTGKKNEKKNEEDENNMEITAKELGQNQTQVQSGKERPPWMVKETEDEEEYKEKTVQETKPEPKVQKTKPQEKAKPTEQKLTEIKPAKPVVGKKVEIKPVEKKGGFLGFLKKKKKPPVTKEIEGIKEPMKMQTATKPTAVKNPKKKPIVETIAKPKPIEKIKPTTEATKPIEVPKPTIKKIIEPKPIESTKPIQEETKQVESTKPIQEETKQVESTKPIQEETKQVESTKPKFEQAESTQVELSKPAEKKPVEEKESPGFARPKMTKPEDKNPSKRFENLVELVKGTGGKVNEKTVEIKKPAVERKPAIPVSEKQALKPNKLKSEEKHYATEKKQVGGEIKETGMQEAEDKSWFKRKKKAVEKKEEKPKVPSWLKKN